VNAAEGRDVLRDAMAVVSANLIEGEASDVIALRVIRKRDDEDVRDWIERVAMLVDILGATAGVFLSRWSDHLVLSTADTLRVFAQQLEASSTARDLAGGNTNEGN
jgi:uncharacterized membrane protein YoaK (UPF0700 family)